MSGKSAVGPWLVEKVVPKLVEQASSDHPDATRAMKRAQRHRGESDAASAGNELLIELGRYLDDPATSTPPPDGSFQMLLDVAAIAAAGTDVPEALAEKLVPYLLATRDPTDLVAFHLYRHGRPMDEATAAARASLAQP